MDMYCNRSTQVSISVVHALEMTRDTLNGTNMERNLTYTGYQTQSYATSKFIFTLHNNYTYALNISDVISTTPGFSITSCYPQLPFILIPNQSETFSLNVTTSTSIAGYFGEIKLQINTTSTLNITITSIHTSVSDNAFLGVPQVDQKIYGNMVAGANSTVMIELYNPYEYSAQVSGFVIETKGFVLVNSYPQIGSYPKTVTNGDSWFNLIIKPTMNMAGYSGGINIQIEDSP